MRALGWVGRVAGAFAVAALLLGLPVLALQTPFVTRALVSRYYDPAEARLPRPLALATAEQVRVYVNDAAAPPLPAEVGGRPAFDEAAASHLRDVRRVLVGARDVTLATALLGAVLIAAALFRGRRRAAAWSLTAGAAAVLAVAVAAGVFGALDFERFFALFHGLFFAAGTWTFPVGSLLIELFPEQLWATLGLLWAAGVLLIATACFAGAWLLRRGAASRARKYV